MTKMVTISNIILAGMNNHSSSVCKNNVQLLFPKQHVIYHYTILRTYCVTFTIVSLKTAIAFLPVSQTYTCPLSSTAMPHGSESIL